MDPSLVVAMGAGAAGGGLLLIARALTLNLDPRPCWQKSECGIRRANATACATCPVYVDRDVPPEAFVTPELNLPPLRAWVEEVPKKAA